MKSAAGKELDKGDIVWSADTGCGRARRLGLRRWIVASVGPKKVTLVLDQPQEGLEARLQVYRYPHEVAHICAERWPS